MATTTIPMMKVIRILDERTLVVAGTGLADVEAGTQLAILAVGPKIPELQDLPLVVEKARVRATVNAGEYLLASPDSYTEEVRDNLFMSLDPSRTRRVTVRPKLAVMESEVIGNPAGRPIAVGDPVIRVGDLAPYISALRGGLPAEMS